MLANERTAELDLFVSVQSGCSWFTLHTFFFSSTVIFQNSVPRSTLACMTVLQMLSKMIGSIELFGLTVFELVNVGEMIITFAGIPRAVGEFLTTKAALIGLACAMYKGGVMRRHGRTGPRDSSQVDGVFMSLSIGTAGEAIGTVCA